ncbi:peptidyl-tRNA hydrolase [Cladochytrium replicatum]|nr:peptidyl-tRNA hydrolase [Cladochytrium replicatum]
MPGARRACNVLIVGLGNYTHPHTRHSVGMMVLDHIVQTHQNGKFLPWKLNPAIDGHVSHCNINEFLGISVENRADAVGDVVLFKPKKLMNITGPTVKKAMDKFEVGRSHLLVIHDDLEHKFGVTTIKKQGSAEGHNGLRSIIQSIRTDDFRRLRVGIGRPSERDKVSEFVLSKFDVHEQSLLEGPGGYLQRCGDMVVDLVRTVTKVGI